MNGQRGMSLVEALVALAILGITLTSILPAFTNQTQVNRRCQERSAAVVAAQQAMESLRFEDPQTMPDEGAMAPQLVTVGEMQFEVVTRFCVNAEMCDADSRHLTVEVLSNGQKIYEVQTVYTQLD